MAVWLLFLVVCLGVSLSSLRSGYIGRAPRGPSDVVLYRAEIERMRAGATYYQAAAAELSARGYPTRALFNWRLPLPMWLLARLPDPQWGKVLLIMVAGATLLRGAFVLLDEQGRIAAAAGSLALAGAFLACALGNLYVMPELSSGVFVCFSLLLAEKRPGWSCATGLAALAVRELALPFVVLQAIASMTQRQWRWAAVWLGGIAVYGGWLAWHAAQVEALRAAPEAIAHEQGWIRFGGAAFVVSLAQMNAFLLNLPQFVAAGYLAISLWGATQWATPTGRRLALTLAGYCVAFSVVGQDFNQYWGWMIAPLLALGFGVGVARLWSSRRTFDVQGDAPRLAGRPA